MEGNKVRVLRQMRGLSQRELAEFCHVSPSILSDVELGKREAYPSLKRRIAAALKAPIGEVFGEQLSNEDQIGRRAGRA